MKFLLLMFSVLFHFLLGLFLFGVGVVTVSGGVDNLKLGMLPWTGAALTTAVILTGLLGMAIAILGLLGRLKFLLPLWAAIVLVMMVKGFFISSYVFGGKDGFHNALWLTLGALLAFLFSWAVFRKKKAAL
ncbi:MAG TPA: hypothetical protein VHD76_02270 [Bryobacteraceae bacterium]|jgi:hypothetical protein|nr:hypothetical protein [Bryobacteraceae bacterium]